MFNSLAQYFLGTSNNSNNLDPGSKANHQEVPTNVHQRDHVEQALAQQNVFQVYPNKRGRARRNRKNKVSGTSNGPSGVTANTPKGANGHRNSHPSSNNHSSAGDSPADACASPDFLLHGITARECEEDEWLFVECAQKANKKGGFIQLHDDDLFDTVDITCLPEDGADVYDAPKPRFEIKHNPLNLNQQQLKRQLRQQNAALISCEDIADDEELMRAVAQSATKGADPEEIQAIAPEQSAVVEGDSVDVDVPPVAGELPVDGAAQQQQQQAHGDEEPSDPQLTRTGVSAPMNIQSKRASKMEESWFVTPPSCFTSQGPVHMETSPLENLLIEHPSMSVYHGVRNMDRSSDIGGSLVVLEKEREMEVKMEEQPEIEESEALEVREETKPASAQTSVAVAAAERTPVHNHDKKIRQKLCRNAMTRSNKTCEMNATKNGPKKRSEKQHAKNASRANNNRKC